MAMTIVELQAFIDSKPDTRAIINEIADYLQANPGGGGVTLYSGDAPIASDRTVDLDGKVLQFAQGGEGFLLIDPTAGSEAARLQAYNTTGDDNYSNVTVSVTNTISQVELRSNFNNGVKEVLILGFADATTSTLTYSADTHAFPSVVAADFANDAAAAVGGIPVGGLYHTAGAAKIRLA